MLNSKLGGKTPKGTNDFGFDKLMIRNKISQFIASVYKQTGAIQISTPILELSTNLKANCGEDNEKLIYELQDQGGELLGLRYDLTIPFARYMASTGQVKAKHYQIGPVYRRDNPRQEKGRFREFIQADIDIAGEHSTMIPESQIMCILCNILTGLQNNFMLSACVVKINHKQILFDVLMKICKVSCDNVQTICSSIDKLDKLSVNDVKQELLNKNISLECISKIFDVFQQTQNLVDIQEFVIYLKALSIDDSLLNELTQLRLYLDELNLLNNHNIQIKFDLSLARGLEYYTGIIFETILQNSNATVGTIAAGGRYDNLLQKFSNKFVPSIGLTIGVDRITSIIDVDRTIETWKLRSKVFVISSQANVINRMKIFQKLWQTGIYASFNEISSIAKQFKFANANAFDYCIIIEQEHVDVDSECAYALKDLRSKVQVLKSLKDIVSMIKYLDEQVVD